MASSRLRQEHTVFKFYSGISVETFDHVKQLLWTSPLSMDYTGRKTCEHAGKKKPVHQIRFSSDNGLLLTLVKLRQKFPESALAVRFAVGQSTVSRTFSTLVLCLYHSFKENCTSTLYVGMHNTVVYMITPGTLFSIILHYHAVSILNDGLYGVVSSPCTRSTIGVQRYCGVQHRKTERTVETAHAHEWYTLDLLVQLITTSVHVHVLEIQLFKLSFSS